METIISAKQIFKSYSDLQVLKGVDISIKQSEVISIVGASGAGKTTLLHILGTLDHPDFKPETELIINNTSIKNLKDKALAKFRNTNIGFIFQFHQLLPEFTALENVCIPAFVKGTTKNKAIKRAKELLDYLGLNERFNHKPNSLSGGEQQRVSVARALINHPKIIFADEPSGNLDSVSAEQLHNLFFELRDEFKQTFVIVTHNNDLSNMTDRKLIMVDGVIV